MTSVLEYLEVHVAHHCNLKCKGCGHYSNFVPEEFPVLSEFANDIARLHSLIEYIEEIRLLGGEPLLNPELPQFVQIICNHFPDADIRIVTNGLLIPHADSVLFQTMRKYNVRFDISLYPPTIRHIENIKMRCVSEKISYKISPEINRFFCFDDTIYSGDAIKNYQQCMAKRCHMMLEGKIALCPKPILRYKYQEYNWEHMFPEDILDLYDSSITGEKLIQYLHQPCRLCAYCNPHPDSFTWEGNYSKK